MVPHTAAGQVMNFIAQCIIWQIKAAAHDTLAGKLVLGCVCVDFEHIALQSSQHALIKAGPATAHP